MSPRRKVLKTKKIISATKSGATKSSAIVSQDVYDDVGTETDQTLVTQSESQPGDWADRSQIEEYLEDDVFDDSTEILTYYQSNYCWNPHETDCFTFPDEYVLATKFCKIHGAKTSTIRLSWLSEEDVSLPWFFTIYQLNAHNTDSFSEENEYVGAIRYYDRLKGPAVKEELIYQINELRSLSEATRNLSKFFIFSENLIMLSKSGEEIGNLEMSAKVLEVSTQLVIELHLESNGIIQGVVCGKTSTSHVLVPTLETISYKHHEFTQEDNEMTNDQLEIIKTDDGFEINRTKSLNGKLTRERKQFSYEEMKNFVTDGA